MDNLDKLLYWRGIANEYVNYRGEHVSVSLDNRLRLLQAMEVEPGSDEALAVQVHDLDVKPWQQLLAPFLMSEEGANTHFDINITPELLDKSFRYQLALEDGSVVSGTFIPSHHSEVGDYLHDGIRYSRHAIAVQNIPMGYHTLHVRTLDQENSTGEQAQFVVVPVKAHASKWVEAGRAPWGIIIQLYTLRSNRNWGIGDFTDLKLLITEAAAAGADMIGLNPLHALRVPVEYHCSPYSPSDRRFLNPLYIDPELESEYQQDNPDLQFTLEALRAPDQVDYAAVDDVKITVFKQMYQVFCSTEMKSSSPRAQAFLNYVAKAGDPLKSYCLYQALAETSGKQIDQLDENEKGLALTQYANEIQFQAYLQWLANEQLESCQKHAKDLGMKVGLMRDLAVGADGGGAEVSTNLNLFCRDAAVGAPPDPLAEVGQNWGLPPMDPSVLRETKFEHYINLLRANMSHCGALRIDHAMSLMRLWWCPPGKTADYGAYVHYPFEQMLGLLKLESVRNQCMVIGEDMGVVPAGFREALVDADIFTNKMFYFEKQNCGRFTPPQYYAPRSLSMLTNHDVPTIASWWVGSDLELRQSLNLLEEGVSFDDVLSQRHQEKRYLLEWLRDLSLVQEEQFDGFMAEPMSQTLASAILHGVSHCASQLFVVQLEDLELLDTPVNVPGTSDQYANWQRKLKVPLEVLFKDESVQTLLSSIASERS